MEYKLNQYWITRNHDTVKIIEILPNGWAYGQSTNDGEIRMYDAEGQFSCPEHDLMERGL